MSDTGETTEHRTFCRICNAMCGLVVTTRAETIVSVRGDRDHPISRGYSCEKGRALGRLHTAPHRLDHPTIGRGVERVVATWPDLLDDLGARLDELITTHGPSSVAMYLASGSAFDAAGRRAAEKFLRLLGSPQKYTATTIDTPSKPLVAEAVGGWSGLTPIWDENDTSLLVLIGSNPVVSHGHSNAMPDPVRRLRAMQERGGELIVVDPRRTETASLADVHLQIRPGSDWLLLAWTVRVLLDRPSPDDVDGLEDLAIALESLDLDTVIDATGLDGDAIDAFVETILRHGRLSLLTGTGTTMNERAVVTDHLAWVVLALTDSFDRPGGMWFNPGLFGRLDERELPIGDGTPGAGPPSRPELPRRFDEWPCVGLLDEIESGNVKALVVVGGNPALAFPDAARTRSALESLDLLATIDIVETATTDHATHVLPAVDPLERADITWLLDNYQLAVAGQYTRRVVAPLADRRPVWWSLAHLAERLGLDLLGVRPDETDDDALLAPLLVRSRAGEAELRGSSSGIVASGPVHGWVRDRVIPDGRWRLAPPMLLSTLRAAVAEAVAAHRPVSSDDQVTLVVHRRRSMMNSQFPELAAASDEQIAVRMHPDRADDFGPDGTRVEVTSPHGSVSGPLRRDDRLRLDTITVSHGSPDTNVSELTSATIDVDPLTGMVRQSGIECTVTPSVDDRDPNRDQTV